LGELFHLQYTEGTGGNEDIGKTERGNVPYHLTSESILCLHTHTYTNNYLPLSYPIPQTNNDLETQWGALPIMRRIIHEVEEAKSELKWQEKNVSIIATHRLVSIKLNLNDDY